MTAIFRAIWNFFAAIFSYQCSVCGNHNVRYDYTDERNIDVYRCRDCETTFI